jgi:hypothetical protein
MLKADARPLVALLGSAVTVTVEGPLPSAGETPSHAAVLAACHEQPPLTLTLAEAWPPLAGNERAEGATERSQRDGGGIGVGVGLGVGPGGGGGAES